MIGPDPQSIVRLDADLRDLPLEPCSLDELLRLQCAEIERQRNAPRAHVIRSCYTGPGHKSGKKAKAKRKMTAASRRRNRP